MEKEILDTFKHLIFKKGIRAVSLDELAREMKISKKTIYQYFQNKEHLVQTLLKNHLDEHKQIIEKIHNESEDVILELLLIMQYATKMLSQINLVVFEDLQLYYKKIWKHFQDFKIEFVMNRIVKILEKGQKQGLIRKNIPAHLMAHLRLKEIELLMDYNFVRNFNMTIQDMQLHITEYFIMGVGTEKGIEKMKHYLKNPEKLTISYNH